MRSKHGMLLVLLSLISAAPQISKSNTTNIIGQVGLYLSIQYQSWRSIKLSGKDNPLFVTLGPD